MSHMGQTRSFGGVGSMYGLPESGQSSIAIRFAPSARLTLRFANGIYGMSGRNRAVTPP
jgi:hypothetical protein